MAERATASDSHTGDGAMDADDLFRELYAQLKSLASGYMRRQHGAHTLQPTALVHEAYLRLTRQDPERWSSRGHMMAMAGRAMRSVLVDHARTRTRVKRTGEGDRMPLDELLDHFAEQSADIAHVDEALTRLASEGPLAARAVQVIEMRFFCGLSMAEAAAALDLPLRTAERDYKFARAWLRQQLS